MSGKYQHFMNECHWLRIDRKDAHSIWEHGHKVIFFGILDEEFSSGDLKNAFRSGVKGACDGAKCAIAAVDTEK